MIALHSLDGVAETGLLGCPPEKRAAKLATNNNENAFSGPVSEQESRNTGIVRVFRRKASEISLQSGLRGGARSLALALSDRIVVRGILEFGPSAIGIISAVFGLIAGVLTQWFVSWRQEKQDDRKRQQDDQSATRKVQQEVERALITGLSIELIKNQTALRQYVDHAGEPPWLSVESYNTLTKNPPVLGYLSDSANRRSYLDKIDSLYTSIQSYHSKLTRNEEPKVIHDAAAALLDVLSKGLEGVN